MLCAGRGERFRPHTEVLPKPLLPFLNVPLLFYNLYLLKLLGVNRWACNVHVHPELLQTRLPVLSKQAGLPLPALSREPELLGSAGGLWKLRSFLEGERAFFYLNGDSFIWPLCVEDLRALWQSHLESGALASFLVKPTRKTQGGIVTDRVGQVISFSSASRATSPARPSCAPSACATSPSPPSRAPSARATGCADGSARYLSREFSGLAVFSGRIFREIRPGAFHIFKDVLERDSLKRHCRAHCVQDLKLLDMNHLRGYLAGTGTVLKFLAGRESLVSGASVKGPLAGSPLVRGPLASRESFIHKILNMSSPGWNRYEGENYFSAVRTPSCRAQQKEGILFCGRGVTGLEKLEVKNFAVLGEESSILERVCMERSVLGQGLSLKQTLKNRLEL